MASSERDGDEASRTISSEQIRLDHPTTREGLQSVSSILKEESKSVGRRTAIGYPKEESGPISVERAKAATVPLSAADPLSAPEFEDSGNVSLEQALSWEAGGTDDEDAVASRVDAPGSLPEPTAVIAPGSITATALRPVPDPAEVEAAKQDLSSTNPSSEPSSRPETDPDRAPVWDEESDPFGEMATGAELGGRYRLEKILGRGATGVVFEASHLVIGKRVALKCLYPHHRAAPNAVERFFREARIAATVEHPNVIQVFDGGDEKETLFLAMELLEGETLGDRLEEGEIAVGTALRYFIAIASGVAAVHAAGVVHRDLKPDNVFLVKSRFQDRLEPKVLDFGISKLKEPGMRELTTLGTVMGTPYYMAPEQITNTRDVDVRADVYSLGVMLYEAIAGDVPYDGDSVLEIFQATQEASAIPLDEIQHNVPHELAEVVARAMHRDRDCRYPSVSAFADAIRGLGLVKEDAIVAPVMPDVRATGSAPLPARRTRTEDLPTPSRGTRSPRPEQRRTMPLQKPLIVVKEKLPAWVLPTLVGAGLLSLASLVVAIVALLL
ncbi:MAG: serine/threonine-protein kinase [Sandaracinaceae bacterium]